MTFLNLSSDEKDLENPFNESGIKRFFNEEIIDENINDESLSPILSKKTCFISKKLKQPFKSPLKINGNHNNNHINISSSSSSEMIKEISVNNISENSSPIKQYKLSFTPKKMIKKKIFRSPLVHKNISDPKMNNLYKKQSELERKIWEMDERIKIIETAKMYENKDDSKLERLINKWREAAQQAAIQLFNTVSERIQAAGGIIAWYKQFETPRNFLFEWDPSLNSEIKDIEENKDLLNNEKTSQSEEFTMTMMLEKLNIPFDLIKWDTETETWL
ncbi:hypothetical protein PCANB_002151 [Pneumocystis canis]|nr:hypothetical protein PCK1_001963 [Pneumocystis canis]KAG5439575.1 hypothetical protein PCANB_002151 [Pneumocystis canis]